jgi:predicted dehydrogenase
LRSAGFDVVGLVGRDAQRTNARAEQFDIEHSGTSITEIAAAANADVITVSTPPNVHHESVMEAIATGCHVLAEKPFALSTTEATEMVAAATAAEVVAMVAFEFRWQPAEAVIAQAIARGDIGEPKLATLVSHSGLVANGLPTAFNENWWGDAAAGGGILNAAGVHLLDRLHTWLGPIGAVSGSVQQIAGLEGGADDTYSALMQTRNGVSISLQHCSAAQGDGASICKVLGTEGTLELVGGTARLSSPSGSQELSIPENLVPPAAPEFPTDDPKHAYTKFELPLFIRLAERLRDEIAGAEVADDLPSTPTFGDGLAAQKVIDAIRSSSATNGAWVELEEDSL